MDKKFLAYVNKLPKPMEKLKNSDLLDRNNLGNIPKSGIYVFYENKKPIYVGRSNGMKSRIQNHGRRSSGHNSATFSFMLAKEKAEKLGIDIKLERKVLEKDPQFDELFKDAKARVARMSVRVIGINDQILQTLFEVYAHLELKTKYNDFRTH